MTFPNSEIVELNFPPDPPFTEKEQGQEKEGVRETLT